MIFLASNLFKIYRFQKFAKFFLNIRQTGSTRKILSPKPPTVSNSFFFYLNREELDFLNKVSFKFHIKCILFQFYQKYWHQTLTMIPFDKTDIPTYDLVQAKLPNSFFIHLNPERFPFLTKIPLKFHINCTYQNSQRVASKLTPFSVKRLAYIKSCTNDRVANTTQRNEPN